MKRGLTCWSCIHMKDTKNISGMPSKCLCEITKHWGKLSRGQECNNFRYKQLGRMIADDGKPIKNAQPLDYRTEKQWEDEGRYVVDPAAGVEMHPTISNKRLYKYYLIEDTEKINLEENKMEWISVKENGFPKESGKYLLSVREKFPEEKFEELEDTLKIFEDHCAYLLIRDTIEEPIVCFGYYLTSDDKRCAKYEKDPGFYVFFDNRTIKEGDYVIVDAWMEIPDAYENF